MAQVVEHLSSNYEALSSKPSIEKKIKAGEMLGIPTSIYICLCSKPFSLQLLCNHLETGRTGLIITSLCQGTEITTKEQCNLLRIDHLPGSNDL
jgi:hypothetical protein